METIIHRLKKQREARKWEKRYSRITYCIRNSDIALEDLIPIPNNAYKQLVAELEQNVKDQKADEPEFSSNDYPMPTGDIIFGYPVRNIFTWYEILGSMKSRRKEAYRLRNHPCRKCGVDNTVFLCFRSSRKSWREQCGQEGYMLICPDCLTILGFKPYLIN